MPRPGALVRSGRASHPDGTEVDPAAWWDALLVGDRRRRRARRRRGDLGRGQQHGMVVLDAEGRVIRPALLWNDTRSAQAAARPDRRGRRRGVRRAHRRRAGRVVHGDEAALAARRRARERRAGRRRRAAARLADLAAARLRPDRASRRSGRCSTSSTTDRSDASGTAYWGADRATTASCSSRALGHDAILPRVLGPSRGRRAHAATGIARRRRRGRQRGGRARPRRAHRATSSCRSARAARSSPSPMRRSPTRRARSRGSPMRRGDFLPLIATLNAARVLDATAGLLGVDHDELGRLALEARARGIRRRARAVLRGRAHARTCPTRPRSFSGLTLANTTRAVDRARRDRGHALRARRRPRRGARPGRRRAERMLLIGGAAQNPAVRAIAAQVFDVPVVVPEPGEYVADGAARQAAWVLTGAAPVVAGRDRRGARGRHARGHPAAVRGGGGTN